MFILPHISNPVKLFSLFPTRLNYLYHSLAGSSQVGPVREGHEKMVRRVKDKVTCHLAEIKDRVRSKEGKG